MIPVCRDGMESGMILMHWNKSLYRFKRKFKRRLKELKCYRDLVQFKIIIIAAWTTFRLQKNSSLEK